jgi:class 3 adenylate cyclase
LHLRTKRSLREIISAYQKCVAETVRRFDGFVAKYMGDGVLVYFGYPQAHEDDAERAVRAGLELIAAVAGLKTRASPQTRVGIATGLVVVGDLIGAGEAQERGIVGETPNLAARLQGNRRSLSKRELRLPGIRFLPRAQSSRRMACQLRKGAKVSLVTAPDNRRAGKLRGVEVQVLG